jgi:hypothetical protein
MPPEPLQYQTPTESDPPGRWFSWRVAFWVVASIIIFGILAYFVMRIAVEGFPVPEPSPYGRPGKP